MADAGRILDLHNIYHIAFLLRQKLVPDIVPIILSYAECYLREASSIEYVRILQVEGREDSGLRVFITKPVQSNARTSQPVRRVTFEIKPHEPGWCTVPNSDALTWFEAAIERVPEDFVSPKHLPLPAPHNRRVIVKDVLADSNVTMLRVEWSADSDDADEAAWLSRLQSGDCICVYGRAHDRKWINHVKSIGVTVDTVAVVK